MGLHYNSDNGHLFVKGKGICKFKASNKNANFIYQFCLRIPSKKFHFVDSEEISFKGNACDFSVDYGA